MKYHILTPFKRKGNMKLILRNFRHPNVIFHPLIDRPIKFPKEDWIEPFTIIPNPSRKHPSYAIWDGFIELGKLVDDDYYLFISDDDFLEPDFFEKLKDINTDIILVSMKRGNHVTKSRYGTNTLIPNWRILMRSRVGGEQLIVKGKILKNEGFGDRRTADGQLIGRLWKKYHKENFTFKTDVYVWFNYLEPGRWDSFKR